MKNKDWSDDFVEVQNGVNKKKTAGESDSFKALFGVPDSYANNAKDNEVDAKDLKEGDIITFASSESAYEVDIQEALFGIPDNYLKNASSSENDNDNDNFVIDPEFGKDDISSQNVEDAEEHIVEENIEGSENMEEPKVVDETFNGDEFTKEPPKKSKVKNLKFNKRFIPFIIAGSIVLAGSGYGIYRVIIKAKKVPNQSCYYVRDDAEGTNTLEESRHTLEKIENCVELSNDLENLYQKYKADFDNLNIGKVSIVDGVIEEFTESEYKELKESIDKLENSKDMSNNDRMQLIYKIVGYSSKLNAYLAYYAYDDIKDTIITNYQNDATVANGDNYAMISVDYDYEFNDTSILRSDNNGTEASYDIGTAGFLNSRLLKILRVCEGNIISIDNFVNSENTTISENTITRNSEGNLTVSWNKERNKELNRFISTVQTQLESTPEIKSGKLKYEIPLFFTKQTTQESSQEQASGYTTGYTRKRTM